MDIDTQEDTKNNKISLSSIVQDNSGGLSSSRILMLMWGIVTLLIWAAGTIPPEVVTILLGITGAKVVQRFGEK
jgi:hypothetical protein